MMIDAFVRLDTALSQSLTGPLVIPPTLGGSAAATSYGSMPLKIAENLLAAAAALITFSSLPSTFRMLESFWQARGDNATLSISVLARLNNDSAANYDGQRFIGSSASSIASEQLAQTALTVGEATAATGTAAYSGAGKVAIANYAGATLNKVTNSEYAHFDSNASGGGAAGTWSGKWRTTATAVNRFDYLPSAGNFVTGSYFAVWMRP
jgi:hypothetical protein